MVNTTDQKVQELFQIVQKKKKEIEKAEKPNWLTNCSFGFDEYNGVRINLHTTTDVNLLAQIYAFLMRKEDDLNTAYKELGLDTKPNWLGFQFGDWKADIKTRIIKVQIKKEKDKLEVLETKLNNLISPELRTKLELEEITKLLS